MKMYIVLGRFQPFHNGHVHLIETAMELGPTTIVIGSAQESWTFDNPFSGDERKDMIQEWLGDKEAKIVQIEDINDPPNWVEHTTKIHGEGTLVTSDESTKLLYEQAGFPVIWVEMNKRESLEGWRVRTTLKMLSTVMDDEAQKQILSQSIPESVVDWLIENDALHRFYELSRDLSHAG
ncbi:MAG TPA: hypothetical protein EYQ73_00150 [Candidatus Poseidoniales archaeon]|nr:MAG: hypothetical protein CXT71_07610 [Euryarchaeota archaeon]HIF45202.1 hypothetical protein [Candidatus Poseidoniales archaeon]HIL65361.1 hypothetical protein [Candidatus Poseidoniales archaeon]